MTCWSVDPFTGRCWRQRVGPGGWLCFPVDGSFPAAKQRFQQLMFQMRQQGKDAGAGDEAEPMPEKPDVHVTSLQATRVHMACTWRARGVRVSCV